MSNNIKDLLNQLPKEVSVEQHYYDEQQKLIHNEEMKFTFGDKLEALDWHKEEHGIEYVTITGINQKTKVYYWEAELNWELGGKLSSGYYFHEAKAYKPEKKTAREYNSPIIQELLDEITPEEMEATKAQMEKELMVEKLKSHLDSISSEQFEKEIIDIETEGYTSGPTMEEFINNQQNLDPEFDQIINDNFWELTDDQTDAWELTDDKTESPYCPVCDACGEDGCCSAINCKQDPSGHYCGTYLKDLKFGYKMDQWVADNLYHKMPKELQAEYDLAWDKLWDETYDKIQGGNK